MAGGLLDPFLASKNETSWIPWDLSQGNETTTVFSGLFRTHSGSEKLPDEPRRTLFLQAISLAVQTISKNGSSEIRTQDQSVKSRVLYR